MKREAFQSARRAFRTYESRRIAHAKDQVFADCPQPFRDVPPEQYWFMATFERRPDPLLEARRTRQERAENLRLSRAHREWRDARSALARSNYSPAWRELLELIDQGKAAA